MAKTTGAVTHQILITGTRGYNRGVVTHQILITGTRGYNRGAVAHQILMSGTRGYNRCRDTSDSDEWHTWLQQQVP